MFHVERLFVRAAGPDSANLGDIARMVRPGVASRTTQSWVSNRHWSDSHQHDTKDLGFSATTKCSGISTNTYHI